MLWFIDVGEVRGRCDQWILSLAAVGEDVVIEQSYTIKADLEKAGAGHAH